VSILQGKALPSIRIGRADFLRLRSQVLRMTRLLLSVGSVGSAEEHLGRLALAAYEACGAEGWGRADFMMDRTGRPLLLEINTVRA